MEEEEEEGLKTFSNDAVQTELEKAVRQLSCITNYCVTVDSELEEETKCENS